ncbi:hypothetical protein V2J09_014850 [Rumex salicifolius]
MRSSIPTALSLIFLLGGALLVNGDGVSGPEIDTGGLSRDGFPEGFVFGTATSAYQVEGMAHEGGRGPCIWDEFVKIPGLIANNGTAEVTVDQYHHYKVIV